MNYRSSRCTHCWKNQAQVVDGKKQCSGCQEFKDLKEFSERGPNRGTRQGVCKPCTTARRKERGQKHKPSETAAQFKARDPKGYERMLLRRRCARIGVDPDKMQQYFDIHNGLCEICHESKKLYLDHDHETGEFRGLLCGTCNSGIGLLGDSLVTVYKAFLYLHGAHKDPTSKKK